MGTRKVEVYQKAQISFCILSVHFMPTNLAATKKPLCLVIGAGFLGSHLIERLVHEKFPVRVLATRKRRASTPPNKNVEWIEGSSSDPNILQVCIHDAQYLFHFAGSTLPVMSNLDPAADVHINLENSLRILLAAAQGGVRKVIFPSSGGTVYGIPKQVPLSEDHPTDPICSYGIGKLTLEKYLAVLERKYGMQYAVLRYSNPFGPGQDPFRNFGAVSTFLGRIARRKPIEIWGNGETVRDFLFIEDAIEATWRAMQYGGNVRIFNIGRGSGTSLNDLVRQMEKTTGIKPRILYRESRPSDVPTNVLDISRARRELGWTPTVPLGESISRTWLWVEAACAQAQPDAA